MVMAWTVMGGDRLVFQRIGDKISQAAKTCSVTRYPMENNKTCNITIQLAPRKLSGSHWIEEEQY